MERGTRVHGPFLGIQPWKSRNAVQTVLSACLVAIDCPTCGGIASLRQLAPEGRYGDAVCTNPYAWLIDGKHVVFVASPATYDREEL